MAGAAESAAGIAEGGRELARLAKERRPRKRVEFANVFLLSIGGLLSAYCSFQSGLWSSAEASSYALASKLRLEANTARTHGGQLSVIDVTTFVAWAQAHGGGDTHVASFLESRLRPEFKPVFEEWKARHSERGLSTPFGLPSYRVAASARADVLAAEADQVATRGDRANALSDMFLAATLIFTLSLFLSGMTPQFHHLEVRLAVLALSTLVLLGGLAFLGTLPKIAL
jgi:hypothetical protein